jgi:hypothetical protein
MYLRVIAIAALAVLVMAPQAMAWSGGGRGASSAVSGNFTVDGQNGQFEGSCSGGSCSGTLTNPNGSYTGSYSLSASEPLSALAVGLGLLGASWLRRRR